MFNFFETADIIQNATQNNIIGLIRESLTTVNHHQSK